MKLISNLSKKSWLITLVILFICLFFMYYFFVYTTNNEAELVNKCSRNIERITNNFIDKVNTYQKNAESIIAFPELQDSVDIESLLNDPDSVNKIIEEIKEQEVVNKRLSFSGFEKKKIRHYTPDKIINIKVGNGIKYLFQTPIKPFVGSLIENSIFDQHVFLKLDSVGEGEVQYSTLLENQIAQYNDSIVLSSNINKASRRLSINIGGTNYIVFKNKLESKKLESEWIICGLIDEAKYMAEKRRFDSWLIFLISAILILVLLSIPILKLFTMSSFEELKMADCAFMVLSLLLGSSLIVLLILSIANNKTNIKPEIDKNLEQLSSMVNQRFTRELHSINKQLIAYDTITNKREEFNKLQDSILIHTNDTLRPKDYEHFKYVFWLNNSGIQDILYSVYKETSTFKENLSHRNYYKNVANENFWRLPPLRNTESHGKNISNNDFVLESIRSTTSGECIAAISKESIQDKYKVIALTSHLYSVIDPILPQGYQFCLIDKDGQVLFHSNSDYNLQENLFSECSSTAKFKTLLNGNVKGHITCRYHENQQRAYITPLTNVPLYLVCMYDFDVTKSSNSQVISVSSLLVLFPMLIFVVQALILILLSLKITKLRKSVFSFRWIKYSNSKDKEYGYITMLFVNLATMLVLILFNIIVFITGKHTSVGLFSCWLAPIFVFCFAYISLSDKSQRNVLHFLLPRNNETLPINTRELFLICSVILLSLVNIFIRYKTTFSEFILLFLFQIILGAIFVIGINSKKDKLVLKWFAYLKERSFSLYIMNIFSWLLIISIIPTFIYFKISYDTDSLIREKSNLAAICSKIESKQKYIVDFYDKAFPDLSDKEILKARKAKLDSGIYELGFKVIKNKDLNIAEKRSNKFLHRLSPSFYNSENFNTSYLLDSASNRKWKSKITGNLIEFQSKTYLHDTVTVSCNYSKINPITFGQSTYNIHLNLIVVFVILVFLFLVFNLLKYITVKLFGHSLIISDFRDPNDKHIKKELEKESHKIFIVGLSRSGKTKLVLEHYKSQDEKNKPVIIYFNKKYDSEEWTKIISDVQKTEHPIVFENFEYNSNSIEAFNKKLELLEYLYDMEKRIVILSGIHPNMIFSYYDELIKETTDFKEKQKIIEKYNLWQQVLDAYKIVYKPITDESIQALKNEKARRNSNLSIDEEESNIRIEHSQLYNYYYSIWNNLSINEKYILYDYAKDGLINTNDKSAINSLAAKGILIEEGSIGIINESFRNFIVSIIKPEEELSRQQKISKKGNWNTFRIVIILIVLGLFTLLWYGNQSILNDFKTILAAVGAIAGLLIRFGGISSAGS